MFNKRFTDYLLVTDWAAEFPNIRFTDWIEVSTNVTVHPCGSVSFTLATDLPKGRVVVFGRRKPIQRLAAKINEQLKLCR